MTTLANTVQTILADCRDIAASGTDAATARFKVREAVKGLFPSKPLQSDIDAIVASLETVTASIFATYNIRAFAVGFGDTGGTMARELNAIAANGGTGHTTFFEVDSPGDLVAHFDTIASEIVSCVYAIEEPSATADPEEVNFYFELTSGTEEVIGMDAGCTNGWRWTDGTHTMVEFCGPQCDRLRAGEVENIAARFGCSTVVW